MADLNESTTKNETSSSYIIAFPEDPHDGDLHNHSGVEYIYQSGRWVVIPIDIEALLADRYVRVLGDTMTGALTCPMFSGHYDLDLLNELPL